MAFKIRLIGGVGKHNLNELDATGEPIYLSAGQTAVTDKPLHLLFPDKIVLVSETDEAGVEAKKPAPAPAKTEDAGDVDVTERFPSAAAAALTIKSKDGMFSIWKDGVLVIEGLASESLVVSEIDDIATA